MHGAPECGTCAPLCWGSCRKEVSRARTTTSQIPENCQVNTENTPGPTRPQTDTNEKPPSVDCRILSYRGNLEEWWTCSVCGLLDRSIRIVTDHVMTFHVLASTHKCDMCKTSFCDAQRLQKHKHLAHEASASATSSDNSDLRESTICYICGLMFEGNNEFLSHIDTCKNRLTPENSVCIVTPPLHPQPPLIPVMLTQPI